jgi:two-component system chemotaxis response regulator CheY
MKTILTVDDSITIRQMTRMVLQEAGYRVIQAEDGVEGLLKLKAQDVHLILTDINMPNMDGIEFTRQVRATAEHKFVPIIMLTTESHSEKKQLGRAAGATGWIVKPFDPDQLLAVVNKVMR